MTATTTPKAALSPEALDQLFRTARTAQAFEQVYVSDQQLHDLYNLLITCARREQESRLRPGVWTSRALEIFDVHAELGAEHSVITYNALITSLEKAGRWETALGRFHEMREAGIAPDVKAYSALISACEKGAQ